MYFRVRHEINCKSCQPFLMACKATDVLKKKLNFFWVPPNFKCLWTVFFNISILSFVNVTVLIWKKYKLSYPILTYPLSVRISDACLGVLYMPKYLTYILCLLQVNQ